MVSNTRREFIQASLVGGTLAAGGAFGEETGAPARGGTLPLQRPRGKLRAARAGDMHGLRPGGGGHRGSNAA